ncbi:MAG: hypothetical protein WCI72_05090 [archaeon]
MTSQLISQRTEVKSIGVELPLGLVYATRNSDGYCVIQEDRGLDLTGYKNYISLWIVPCNERSYVSSLNINSLSFLQRLSDGRSSLLDEQQFDWFQSNYSALLAKSNLIPIRTTPELERILADAKK